MSDRRGAAIWSDELLDTVDRWEGIENPPMPESRKHKDGIRIFRHDFVENYLSKAHPITPLFYTLPFTLWALYRGIVQGYSGVWGTLGWMALGVFLWTFVEYALHRWLFHLRLPGWGGKMFAFMAHGYHHEFPDDKMRLVAPPLMLAFLGAIVGFIYYLVFGTQYWVQVFGGTFIGYLGYDWIHYYTHHFRPKGGVGKWLRQYHLLHHFDPDYDRFGISNPLWDVILRTYRGVGN